MLNYVHIDRTCTQLKRTPDADEFNLESHPIDEYRNNDAFVLLAGPGAGKTAVFKYESHQTDSGLYITARDFLTFDLKPEWSNKTLFIDGLNEVRAGRSNSQTPFDAIRSKIEQLGNPRFRLSCRNAYWYGSLDRGLLEKVSPTGEVGILTLDPLTNENIDSILKHPSNIDYSQDIDSGIDNDAGFGELMKNPLLLGLITVTGFTANGSASRMEIFSRACDFLIDDYNLEHATAIQRSVASSHDLAAQMSALALLSGCIGFSLDPNESDCNFVTLKSIPDMNPDEFRQILDSKLFVPQDENRFVPVHWQFVEFLAANYVALKIEQGLPVKRVLSLISGIDQVIVLELRGFSTWLASHSTIARDAIIQRNSLDIALNGDMKCFSVEEKILTLRSLKTFVEQFANPKFLVSELRTSDLISRETADIIRQELKSIELRGKAGLFDTLLLNSLSTGTDVPGFLDILTRIVRNNNVQIGVRKFALKAILNYQQEDSSNSVKQLRPMLEDIFSEEVEDPNDDLLGMLLKKFYPESLSVAQTIHYLRPRKIPHYFGEYYDFWTTYFCINSNFEQLAEALHILGRQLGQSECTADSIAKRPERIFAILPLIILDTLLDKFADSLDVEQLFEYLGIASGCGDEENNIGIGTVHRKRIRKWLEKNTEIHREVIAEGVKRCAHQSAPSDRQQFNRCVYLSIERRTFGAKPQSDFDLWCLDQAKFSKNPLVAEYYVDRIAKMHCDGIPNEGLSGEFVLHQFAKHPTLCERFEKRTEEIRKLRARESSWEHHQTRRSVEIGQDLREYISSNRSELLENRGQPKFLFFSAIIYFGKHADFQQKTPHERISTLLKNDPKSIEILLESFRKIIDRSDMPDMEEILRLRSNHKGHQLMLPFLAGFVELINNGQPINDTLTDKQLKTAITIFIVERASLRYDGNSDLLSNWFTSLLKSHPQLLAEILVRCNLTELQVAGRYGFMVHELSSDRNYATVAKFASLPLLEAFPMRPKQQYLIDLGLLLKAAVTNCETEELLHLIEEKLSFNSMTLAQRGYWLAAGVLIKPDLFHLRLQSYVDGNERRVRFLARAAGELFTDPELSNFKSVEVLAILIESIGFSFGPQFLLGEFERNDYLVANAGAAVTVRVLINRLGLIPTEQARKTLQEIASKHELTAWQPFIDDAMRNQRNLYREASFNYESIDNVQRVLNNLEPVNSGDLAAVVIDRTDCLNNKIRNSNTSDWKQYWNIEGNGRISDPKPESACRDAWLSDLQTLLEPIGIDAQPEGVHANDKRSDIRISYREFCIPVEIKHSRSADLWTACKNQLIKKYVAPEIGADGYGVYLVFWFGEKFLNHSSDGIELPTSAHQLEIALGSQLSEEEQEKIYVRVVDVSEPGKQ